MSLEGDCVGGTRASGVDWVPTNPTLSANNEYKQIKIGKYFSTIIVQFI